MQMVHRDQPPEPQCPRSAATHSLSHTTPPWSAAAASAYPATSNTINLLAQPVRVSAVANDASLGGGHQVWLQDAGALLLNLAAAAAA